MPSNLAIIHQKAIINQENESEKQRIYSILKKLDEWVNEKDDEKEIRQNIMDKIEIIDGKPQIEGNLDLRYCLNLKSRPKGLRFYRRDLDTLNCTALTSLPDGLTVHGNLDLKECTNLISLPDGLTVHGNLTLIIVLILHHFQKG